MLGLWGKRIKEARINEVWLDKTMGCERPSLPLWEHVEASM